MSRLRRIFPTTLEKLAKERGWALTLGIQLRRDEGREGDPNEDVATILRNRGATDEDAEDYAEWFVRLRVHEPPSRIGKTATHLTIPEDCLAKNRWGTFIRQIGGTAGLKIIPAPHLFLWNEFAAFSDQDFVFRHPKVGLAASAKDANWLKAVSVIWTSSITTYCLFLDLSASWGVSRSTIDLGDARAMPMPDLSQETVNELAKLHSQLAAEESHLKNRKDWQRRLDDGVASILSIPMQIMLLARELKEFRLPLVKGGAPRDLTRTPEVPQLQRYASRLKLELDRFMERKPRRHAITLLKASAGLVATVELMNGGKIANAIVRDAKGSEESDVQDILSAAEEQYGQWVYVRRSVRVFAGKKIHICKPPRRLEWTETQALLDAADVIAEVAESRGRN
jgi:hypothetical protein